MFVGRKKKTEKMNSRLIAPLHVPNLVNIGPFLIYTISIHSLLGIWTDRDFCEKILFVI